jgi:lipopolysaccharide transport system ATP-binding protein
VGTGTLSHDLNRWWAKIRGKDDPFLKMGETNDREQKGATDYVWALRDIDFEVIHGEVLGIIGKNGAGKSTLLKILSKTTSPTIGKIKAKGRIASLLEVGTGFHPEMTGRENIFLNGAILGMTRKEIKAKFDEILDFSGVERYVDTPVKRYSSGMYVRLAFAVAAHLEPEILIVDEVLAVGDAEFQKKCLGKMKDVSVKEGRTVLFVSHNMTAIKSLCSQVMLLKNGELSLIGNTDQVMNNYQLLFSPSSRAEFDPDSKVTGNENIRLDSVELENNEEVGRFCINEPLTLKLSLTNRKVFSPINVNIFFNHLDGTNIFATCSTKRQFDIGPMNLKCRIPANFLNDNIYSLSIMVVTESNSILDVNEALVIEGFEPPREAGWLGKFPGYVRPKFEWQDY